MSNNKHKCPCCGYFTIESNKVGTYDICPVCYWESDDIQNHDPTYEGGANEVSLSQARENFKKIGVSDESFSSYVRPPLESEK